MLTWLVSPRSAALPLTAPTVNPIVVSKALESELRSLVEDQRSTSGVRFHPLDTQSSSLVEPLLTHACASRDS